jgi:hypothetical protein
MSIANSLEIQTRLSVEEIEALLRTQLPLVFNEAQGELLGETLTISVSPSSRLNQAIIKDSFGFCPTITVGFQYLPYRELLEPPGVLMLKTTMLLLVHDAGDAVLLWNGDTAILQRTHGQLALNRDFSFWHEDSSSYFSLIPLPYTIEHLPAPR